MVVTRRSQRMQGTEDAPVASKGMENKVVMDEEEAVEELATNATNAIESEDDEAPEAVSTSTAKEMAMEQMRHEKQARAQASKKKRKGRSNKRSEEHEDAGESEDADPEEQEPEAEVVETQVATDATEELPEDVISALAAREANDETEEVSTNDKPKKITSKRKTHIRQFGNIKVQSLDTFSSDTSSQKLSTSAEDFLLRMTAPKRQRMDVLEGHPAYFCRKS